MKYYKNHTYLQRGFTLLEILVVIAIVGVLSTIVLAALSSSNAKGLDAKVQAQLKSMVSQASLFLGTNAAVAAGTGAVLIPIIGGTNLFNSSTASDNSMYRLINALPSGTVIYYAANGTAPVSGGLWALAASTSTGSYCVDYTGIGRIKTGTVMTTATSGAASGPVLYPNLASSYICN